MDSSNGLISCLAMFGAFVLGTWLLTTFWAVAVALGPFFFAIIMVVVFLAGAAFGSRR